MTHNKKTHNELIDGLETQWDELLREGLVVPPADFMSSVMQQLQHKPKSSNLKRSPFGLLIEIAQSAVVLVATLAALWQTLAFVFGLWAMTAAY